MPQRRRPKETRFGAFTLHASISAHIPTRAILLRMRIALLALLQRKSDLF
jgi:hypothetical protein